jgi:hypothetical protein
VDRHKLDRPEPAVDSAYELIDARAEVLVFLHVLSGGDGELDKDDLGVSSTAHAVLVPTGRTYLANPLGVLREEDLERLKLLRNTLDVVKSVNTDDDLFVS